MDIELRDVSSNDRNFVSEICSHSSNWLKEGCNRSVEHDFLAYQKYFKWAGFDGFQIEQLAKILIN